MRDEEIKGKIIAKLATLWMLHPEQRFGQLLENYIFPSVQLKTGKTALTWFQDDAQTLAKLEELTASIVPKPTESKQP